MKTPDYDSLAFEAVQWMVSADPDVRKLQTKIAAALKAAHASGLRDGAEYARQAQRRHDDYCRAECKCADGFHVAAVLDAAADAIAPPSGAPELAHAPAAALAGSGTGRRAEASAATREPGG